MVTGVAERALVGRGVAGGTAWLVVGLVWLALLFGLSQWHRARAAGRRARQVTAIGRTVAALDGARDLAEMHEAVLGFVADTVGDDLHLTAWLLVNSRGVVAPIDIRGPFGPVERAETDIDRALSRIPAKSWAGSRHDVLREPDGGEAHMVAMAVPHRAGSDAALLVVSGRPLAPETEDAISVVLSHAALTIDNHVQTHELNRQRTEARFRQLVRHSTDAVFIVGRDGRVRFQTPSVVRLLGYLTSDLDGATLDRIVESADADHFESFLEQITRAPSETVRTVQAQLRRADGSTIHAEIVGLNLLDDPDVAGVVVTVRDVSERQTLEDQLRHQAFHDQLTGLSNRALFMDRVDHAINRGRREASGHQAVVFLDLDDFKAVNDSLGHAAGDRLLVILADRLRACLRSGDTPARLGGDEFAILLEDAIDTAAVVEVAERVLDSVHAPVRMEGREVFVRASVGVAVTGDADMTAEELLRHADLAMYTAKSHGKGRVEVFEPDMHRRVVDRLVLGGDLERSVQKGEIGVAYQPILSLADGSIMGFEALARWHHPERGWVSPVEFVAMADDSGVFRPLGRLVLDQACRQMARWLAANPGARWQVTVNLSARQVLDPDLLVTVQAALDGAGLDPAALVVELTEAVILADSEGVLRRLHQLKDLGVDIAIDHFGTGYSSLSYLQRVPFDILKIDRGLVSTLRDQDPESTLVPTIIDLARTLGRRAIAEGIEQQVELDGLRQLDCELGQGYHLRRPGDASTLEAELGLRSLPA